MTDRYAVILVNTANRRADWHSVYEGEEGADQAHAKAYALGAEPDLQAFVIGLR